MHIIFAWIFTILYWIIWPIVIILYYLFTSVVEILKLLYWPIGFLLQPVVYLGRFIAACLALPFRALVKLEPLYNYIGVATLVGLLGGLILFYIYNAFHRLLRLDSGLDHQPSKGRTAKKYRQTKARSKAKSEPHLLSPGIVNFSDGGLGKTTPGRHRNLLDQTIMEEMDSDY
ncbi:hypothetical protein Q7P37_002495 [Cladosporium fusiforme]